MEENIEYFNDLENTLKNTLISKFLNYKNSIKQYKDILTKIQKEETIKEEYNNLLIEKRKIEKLRINAKKMYNRGNINSLKTYDLNLINSDLYSLIDKLKGYKDKYEEIKSKLFYRNKKEKLKELEKLINEYDSKIKNIFDHTFKYEINKIVIAMQQCDNRKKKIEETSLFLELKIYNLALEICELLKDREEILIQIKEKEQIDFKNIINFVDEDIESVIIIPDKVER